MQNTKPTAFNLLHSACVRSRARSNWMLVVGCWWLAAFIQARAQVAITTPPSADVLPNVTATAEFDPPVVRAGGKTFYRVMVTAMQDAIEWPDRISAPPELPLGAVVRGQLTQQDGTPFRPLSAFVFEVTPTQPGIFSVPGFALPSGLAPVKVPAATLEVVATNVAVPQPRRLLLEFSETNLFFGQPVRARVILPAGPGNPLAALRDVQFSGDGFMADKLSARLTVAPYHLNGQPRTAFIYEVVLTPLTAGQVRIAAEAFTASLFAAGPITISAGGGPVSFGGAAQTAPAFLLSDATTLNVRPLPTESELPGFTGAIGKLSVERMLLATNRLRVGEPVLLTYGFNPGTNLVRFVPPDAPRSRDWQIIAGKPGENNFTLIPLTDEATDTPRIPFCAFDPSANRFYDLSIPAFAVTVTGDGLPEEIAAWDDGENKSKPAKLSALAATPGKTVASLRPLQTRVVFGFTLFLPVTVFLALWCWDERRRFLEAHPEIARRRRAQRELRRVRRALKVSAASGDAAGFRQNAVKAMRIAAAPHYPAEPRALVGADVLQILSPEERVGRAGEVVRHFFAAADAAAFAATLPTAEESAGWQLDFDLVLLKLEEQL